MSRLDILNKRVDRIVKRLYKLVDAIERHYSKQDKNYKATLMVMGAWQLRDYVDEIDYGTREVCDGFTWALFDDLARHDGVRMPKAMALRMKSIRHQMEVVYVW